VIYYRSKSGDMIDAIASGHYGRQDSATVVAVFEANPGLADLATPLPEGLRILLPDVEEPRQDAVRLWS